MKFSEYIILDKQGGSVDPLGFLRPSGVLKDMLFKQFTVLANHPAYHGFLACAYQFLSRRNITPAQKSFAREFRNLEIFWGILNTRAGQSILNVTKYNGLVQDNLISLAKIRGSHPIFYRLNYGTLGHYSRPSISWGILDKEGTKLTELGKKLADAYEFREGINLIKWLERWYSKEEFELEEILKVATAFRLNASPSQDEQNIWQEIISEYCQRNPHVKVLWDNPIKQDDLGAIQADEKSYIGFFPKLIEKYNNLKDKIELIRMFESLSALVQFVFEREYLTCQYEGKNSLLPPDDLEKRVAQSLQLLAADYCKLQGPDAKKLFRTLSDISGYAHIAKAVMDHHVTHQNSKKASPFIKDGQLLIKDKVDKDRFTVFWEKLSGEVDEEAQIALINFQYRRDWHFWRAILYHDYSRGNI